MSLPDVIEIRPMICADLDVVLAIEQHSFKTPWKREHFEAELAANHSFPLVAVIGKHVAGYVCLMSLFEDAQILDIAVNPDLRGRGVGLMLMERAEVLAREKQAETLSLEVRSSSTAAIALYERCGFHRTGIRARYYDACEDAVLMEKNLKETP
jgi:ribosomal-protein-alanine N-acetyltransferase